MDYIKPSIDVIGDAKDIVKGGVFNKEISAASDTTFDSEGNPLSVPD